MFGALVFSKLSIMIFELNILLRLNPTMIKGQMSVRFGHTKGKGPRWGVLEVVLFEQSPLGRKCLGFSQNL